VVARVDGELISMSEQCRVTEEEVGELHATGAMIPYLALGTPSDKTPVVSLLREVSGQLEEAVVEGVYFGALTVLSLVTSHYDGIDLPAVRRGFTGGRSDEKIHSEWEGTPFARVPSGLISLGVVLQTLQERIDVSISQI
jgi:hypothetical protein